MFSTLTKAWGKALTGARKGTRAIATGQTQAALGMQSPQLAGGAVRIGRFLYLGLLGWIGVSWYTGFVNERTESGSGPVLLLTPGNHPIINSPDRPDKSLGDLVSGTVNASSNQPSGPKAQLASYTVPNGANRTLTALLPSQLGVPGTAVGGYLWSAPSGEKQAPPYDATRYHGLLDQAQRVATTYHLTITSGYRPGSTGSLHGHGLAFDMVGRMADMKAAASWASANPALFQEIFIHNEGSGVHLHVAFYPDAADIINKGGNRYNKARSGPAPAQTASRLRITTT